MRVMLATAMLVVCAVGCDPAPTEDRDSAPRPAAPHRNTGPSAPETPSVTVIPDPPSSVPPVINQAVTQRVHAALAAAGAKRLDRTPGYEGQVNTAFTGRWRERPFRAYAMPSADSMDGELTLVSSSVIAGQTVEVMQVADGAVRLVRFFRGPDTWLLASLSPNLADSDMRRTTALVAELLS